MNLTIDNILTIGTIVLLKTSAMPIMIIGYAAIDEEGKLYDYKGCIYPYGVLEPNECLIFNNSDIIEIVSQGFISNDIEDFKKDQIEVNKKIKSKLSLEKLGEEKV